MYAIIGLPREFKRLSVTSVWSSA